MTVENYEQSFAEPRNNVPTFDVMALLQDPVGRTNGAAAASKHESMHVSQELKGYGKLELYDSAEFISMQDAPQDGKPGEGNKHVLPKELMDAADATAKVLDEFGPTTTRAINEVERSVQLALAKAPQGREKEFVDAFAKRMTESSKKWDMSFEQSQFSKNRMSAICGYRDRDSEIRFSVDKVPYVPGK